MIHRLKNLVSIARIKSAIFIGLLFIISIIWLKYLYYFIMIILCLFSYNEWKTMLGISLKQKLLKLMFANINKRQNQNTTNASPLKVNDLSNSNNTESNNDNHKDNFSEYNNCENQTLNDAIVRPVNFFAKEELDNIDIEKENKIEQDRKLFFFVIMPGFLSLIFLRMFYDSYYTLIYFLHVWFVDMLAMISGKLIGGMKLAPKLSPNKTISGFLFGILIASYIATLISNQFIEVSFNYLLIIFIFLGILHQLGDLQCSYFKRKYNIKDFSNIIPGHGGILDRFDSIVISANIFFILILLRNFYF